MTVADLFESVVDRHPDTVAVTAPDLQMTYAELASRTRRLARRLIAAGVGPEDVVAVVTDRSTSDWLIGILGVVQAGAAYLALDPSYPAKRIAFMLDDAAPRLILHASALDWDTEVPQMLIGEAVSQDSRGSRDFGDSAIAPADRASALGADNLAYVVYTSGSTGQPKGVAVTHRGMESLAATQERAVGTGPRDQVLQWASPSFDAAFWDITLALLHGATLHLAAQEDLLPGEPLADTLRGRGITHATLPPVALGALDADAGLLKGSTIVSTGDTCTQGIVDQWASERTLVNGYGPTETTVGATLSAALTPGRTPDIGTPFDGARVDVVDDDLECVADGIGELAVGGHGVARGYLRRPRLTADRFRPDPRGSGGARIYLTGDLGHRTADGHYHFAGRRDDQVKIRGYRIELSEIEHVLMQHPDVLAAVVGVRQLQAGEDSVVAWLMAAPGATDSARIRQHLADRLPRHMVPTAILVLDRLPTNTHGKIDRNALPLPERTPPERTPSDASDALGAADARDALGTADEADALDTADARDTPEPEPEQPAEDGLESAIAALFAESLNAGDVELDDNFFDLGGDSIKFTRIVSHLNREKSVHLPLREAISNASPRNLARLVAATAKGS